MKIDSRNFPIVHLNYATSNRKNYNQILLHLKQLLDRKEPFVIIGKGVHDSDEERVDDRRKISFWAQANKKEVQKYIKVHLYIVQNEEDRKSMEEFSETFEEFWGYPLVAVNSEEEALSKAYLLLES
ncbi:hypothetical protein [Wohlfahrtiimonas larvae]|uniref:Uncharacterized protein n=1 Tax=Wohlfahrtiimonas larvae TaxID=1157986 RepID=A0ABP9MUP0_9GAMM|nr:hypothetical protein [Wohlfahrtiimonas larvae]